MPLQLEAHHLPKIAASGAGQVERLDDHLCPVEADADAASRKLTGPELGCERAGRSEEHTSELQSRSDLVCRLLLEKKKNNQHIVHYHQNQKNEQNNHDQQHN